MKKSGKIATGKLQAVFNSDGKLMFSIETQGYFSSWEKLPRAKRFAKGAIENRKIVQKSKEITDDTLNMNFEFKL